MKVVVFVCGKGEFGRYKGEPQTLRGVSYRECIEDKPVDSTKVSHVFVLSDSFAQKNKIPSSGIRREKTEELLKAYFNEVLDFLRARFGKETAVDDVSIITHWNYGGVLAMEEYVEEVRQKIANEGTGIPQIGKWKSFSYSSTRKKFFPERCNILPKDNKEIEIPNPKDCDEILEKLCKGFWKIDLNGDVNEMFSLVMALLNH